MDDGGRQLRELARDLDRAAAALRKDLPKVLRRASKPMVTAIRAEAKGSLPRHGGLGKYVARATITTVVRTGADTTTLQLRGRRKQTRQGGQLVDLPAINLGRLRHPVYGRRPWVTQPVRAGFWDRGAATGRPAVDREMQAAINDLRRRIETGH